MNILIVGLGLMGASYAKGLIGKHYIYGVDKSLDTIKYALDNNIINAGSNKASDYIKDADLIILGLYPKDIISFLKDNKKYFKQNQVITDLCGVKRFFLDEAIRESKPASYVSHHPMAGREKIGIKYSDPTIFYNANFLIISDDLKHVDILKEIASDLKFGKVSIINKEKHDKMIGFTSQLTHAIAVSLVNSDTENDTKSFIGDSYRDLTRIAKINKELWSDLFLSNKDYLINEINNFEIELDKLKEALIRDDSNTLKDIFEKSKIKREEMEK